MTNYFKDTKTFTESFETLMELMFQKKVEDSNNLERYQVLSHMANAHMNDTYEKTESYMERNNLKKVIYFSMEFLIGRLLNSNLHNLGIYEVAKEGLEPYGIDLNDLEDMEIEPGLGNGGLGRLGSCFLDSAASIGVPFYGNSLRYEKGFFLQKFENFKQIALPYPWLEEPFVWEERREDYSVQIPFYGYLENTKLINPVWVMAVPYDIKVIGAGNNVATHLRVWKAEPSTFHPYQDDKYLDMVASITRSLYPDDSTEKGKTLRLQQQYLFSSAGLKAVILEHKRNRRNIKDLADYYVFQLNDTHPALVIPELMRILMDEEGLGYEESFEIVQKTCAFTNHTILQEALEKWNIQIFRNLLPRIYQIIQELDRRYKIDLVNSNKFDERQIYQMGIIGEHSIRMANLSIYGSFSVNGVAALHSDILKNIEMNDFYKMYPEKFNNKTNGVTHRRWLAYANPELSSILDKYVEGNWRKDLRKIDVLRNYADDKKVLKEIDEMKLARKKDLAAYILKHEGIEIDPKSIFDIQIKRLHEYKRQLLNIVHVIYTYQRLKYDKEFRKNYYPRTFIFGAKAAPSYHMAKAIIELINQSASVINKDLETNHLLKVVFVENYNVTYAEKLMTAADLSEQISTASKEASGTGNMKFMMNGAITIGTMDGANVEIVEHAGIENEIIFGLTSDEVTNYYKHGGYNPREVFSNDARLQGVFFFIRNLNENPHHYDYILNNLLNSDVYFVLKDFASYVEAHEEANRRYKNRSLWLKQSLLNIASSHFFSSDRTINDYNKEIWKLKRIKK